MYWNMWDSFNEKPLDKGLGNKCKALALVVIDPVLGSGIRVKPLYKAVLSVLNHEDCYGIRMNHV
jgi:hypothetical protein